MPEIDPAEARRRIDAGTVLNGLALDSQQDAVALEAVDL